MYEGREEEITDILILLHKYWLKHPQQRLGQLISNLSPIPDPFYVKDETFVEKMQGELKPKRSKGRFWSALKILVDWNKEGGHLTRTVRLARAHSEKTGMDLEDSLKAVDNYLRSEV